MAFLQKISGRNWMGELPEYLQHEPLYRIAIPGSHHSCSSYMDEDCTKDRENDPLYRLLYEELGEIATTISHRWSVTQEKTLIQQLDLGVRYLDVRVIARRGDRDDRHVYIRGGPDVLLILREIRRWVDLHPTEVVILDFRVVHKMSAGHHRYLIANLVQDVFEDKLVPFTNNIKALTLKNVWAMGLQILVIYPKEFTMGYTSVWPNDFIDYFIPDSQTSEDMIGQLEHDYTERRSVRHFVCRDGVLTLTNGVLAEHLAGTLKDKLSNPATKAVTNWVRDKDRGQDKMNIVVADFVNLDRFCDAVINVNYGFHPLKRYDYEKKSCVIL